MQLYLLDTNTVSYILNGRSMAARKQLYTLPPTNVACISAITEAELNYGIAKLQNDRRQLALDVLLLKIPVRPWDSDAAVVYGPLRAKLESDGRMLAPLDTQIAAHAIALGATLVTRDKVFQQVSNLPGLVNWATDL